MVDSPVFRNIGTFLNDSMWPFKEILLDEKSIYNSSYFDRHEISELNDTVNLEILLPGIDKEEIDIEIEGSLLKIRVPENKERKWIKSYSKDFSIGDSLDFESVKTSMKNGILLISFEKKSKRKSKKIFVS